MRQPDAPFLELSFYFADRPEVEALTQLIAAIADLGGRFTGHSLIQRGAQIRDRPFASITSEPREIAAVADIADVMRYMADPNVRLLQVSMAGTSGTTQDVAEIVTLLSISPEAAHADHHPLAVWTDGWLFSGEISSKHQSQARATGLQAYQRFKEVVRIVRPSYAAITVEYGLECPTDLRRDPRSAAFLDFYVSQLYLGALAFARIQGLFADAYSESMGDGKYISSSEVFNPQGRKLDIRSALENSSVVAQIIGSASK